MSLLSVEADAFTVYHFRRDFTTPSGEKRIECHGEGKTCRIKLAGGVAILQPIN